MFKKFFEKVLYEERILRDSNERVHVRKLCKAGDVQWYVTADGKTLEDHDLEPRYR